MVGCADRGGQGEDALRDAGGDAFDAAAAVQFQVELTLPRVVDRLDQLTHRLGQIFTWAWVRLR
jgi:hypothetical protein